jgi:hypothetical protein
VPQPLRTPVLTCQSCPYAWEPGTTERTELDELMRTGCPECGDWLWLNELAEAGGRR